MKIRVYKKGLILGMGATILVSQFTGCAKDVEVVVPKPNTASEDPDWVKKRLEAVEMKELTKEEIERAFVDAFEKWALDIESSFQSLQNSTLIETGKEKIATTFITMTDVLFYGKPIVYGDGKTITISEMGDIAKEKIQLIYSTVDSKIESYWPGYKDQIEEKWQLGKGYVSTKANSLKLYLLDKASQYMTKEDYEKTGEYWELFKQQSKSDLEDGKDLLQDSWNKGTDFADEKYQDFKKEHEEGYSK